jgi:hypothetical protein
MANELKVKDGLGTIQTLSAISASDGISTYHALTGTIASSISSSLNHGGKSAAEYLLDIYTTLNPETTVIEQKITAISSSLNVITSSINVLSSSLNYSNNSIAQLTYNYTRNANRADISAINYTLLKDGTARRVDENSIRQTLTLFNHTDGDVYVCIGNTPVTASSGIYTYAIAPSGSYISEQRYGYLAHYYSGSSAVTTGYLTITEIEI